MKYTVKKIKEESRVEIKFIFTKEEYDAKFEENLAKAMANAELKGFRKGKVPRNMFIKHFGTQQVSMDTANDLINASYKQAVEEKNIEVVEMADIDLLTKLKDTEWGYVAKVHVYPEVECKDYLGLDVKKEEVNVNDDVINDEVKRQLGNHAELETVEDGTLEKGMTAIFDFTGYVDGEKFEGGSAENYELEIGSGQFIPGFEDQMVGMKNEEERTLKVKFPHEYAEKLADKDAEFVVKLHEIKKRVLPELNDDFVADLDLENVKTVNEWKEYLKKKLTDEQTEANNNKFEDDVFKKVLENNQVYIPEAMINNEIDKRVKQLEDTAKQYGMPAEMLLKYQGVESVDAYRKLLVPGVTENIHYEVVIAQIAKQEKVKLSKEDYDKYYERLANGKDVKEIKKQYPKDMVTNYFKLLKAHDLVLESVGK